MVPCVLVHIETNEVIVTSKKSNGTVKGWVGVKRTRISTDSKVRAE